ncbi:30S ribosomal protein S17 [Desulfovermiculus halophilus]|jgi:small subunit ribosomal protein S17|uniref:30S ribosomal protein S17 n=1 Tax=Desulfovermiculus halophilus TaxID=339722 RepID=UPI000481BE37|nr:30S ribosomal protein S17 [Desulfovermiculus halophilus]
MNKSESQGTKRMLTGYVISNKTDKTVVVRCETIVQHALYKKYIRRRKKLMAHDPENTCQIGDKIQIIESRPLSRRKRWHVHSVLEQAV